MMETLKKYWAYIAAGIAGLFGIIMYMLSSKSKEVNALNAQVALATTEKHADVLEAQINALKADETNTAQHNAALDKTLQAVQDKRAEIVANQKAITDPKAIADYWNKQ